MNSSDTKHLETRQKISLFFYTFFLLLSLAACGGGGGGGGAPVTFTGKTSPAEINESNAENLSAQVLDVGQARGGTLRLKTDRDLPRPGAMDALLTIVGQKNSVTQNTFSAQKPVAIPQEVEAGSCGGQLVVNGTVDDENGDFNVNLRFEGFCESGWTFSGTVNAQGNENSSTLVLKVSSLTVSDGTVSTTMNGSMKASAGSLTTSTITLDVAIRDNGSGRTFLLEDYRVITTFNSSETRINISGRFYEPDEGFVEISTPQSLRILAGNRNPSSGVLEARGAGNTRMRLTALSSAEFRLDVDANEDGLFESTTVKNWSELNGTPVGA